MPTTLYRLALKLEALLYGLILLMAATDDREPGDDDPLASPLEIAA